MEVLGQAHSAFLGLVCQAFGHNSGAVHRNARPEERNERQSYGPRNAMTVKWECDQFQSPR
jgi:hypothetical protein